jgi:hypothetical protein
MTITVHKTDNRPILANRDVAYSKALSLSAKGLMCLVENEPDDFEVIPEEIAQQFPMNSAIDVEKAIAELIQFGYLEMR